MKIKHKLMGLSVISVIALVSVLAMSKLANDRVETIGHVVQGIGQLEVTLLNLRRNEKDFLMRKNLKYRAKFQNNISLFKQQLSLLNQELSDLSIAVPELDKLPVAMTNYQQKMMALISAYEVQGLDTSQGKYRTFLSSSEKINQLVVEKDINAPALYELIQTAKLFVLTGDPEYATLYQQQLAKNNAQFVADYGNAFSVFTAAVEAVLQQKMIIGLSYNQGLRGDIRTQSHLVEKTFATVSERLTQLIDEQKQKIIAITSVVVIIIIALLLGLSWVISMSIQRRLTSLSSLMAQIAKSHDLSLQADQSGNDEFSQMAQNFNYLLAHLRQLIGNVKAAVEQLSDASGSLQQRSRDTEKAMKQQQEETNSVATAITEMGITIREISNNTEVAAANAERSQHIAQEGIDEVSATKDRIRLLAVNLENTNGEVESLSSLSEEIGSVLDVIMSIAEQTNLLALNAAIEAARAGEQGRGFAVVADEVRSLALRTRQSTEEITTIISSLQRQTDQVVTHIVDCREQGEASVEQVNSAEHKIASIMSEMQQIMDMSTQIATAVEQQSITSEDITVNITSIRDITENNFQVAHQNAVVANVVAEQAEELDKAITGYKV
ncbi:methyl-accepting chemotaxis protein [Photobacterium sp. GB-27]|uniref:methyl-accepting chemotaxis protein n=1 Tax=unclassified Photobacterium TaxID=2628852 RepID=UPI000D16A1AD|nr:MULTISPECIES: HAMP domain-containing methyl-accepting chemotaxis protein [unclassified Photobacterium]PSV26544.1 methyl-accepting chemotaxis protein [Photobacterium sp. GB-56]PSV31796.1 methyl-accepting chemotaxis protein [Photobacterium sp. GB-72]PSV37442.1 methyl-accepting chemotaxis protein [Photobacterium sp. GB-27]PSV57746.1 methyl-accepting chemotaxis protein [Photobacterium sp. GB-3]